MKKRVLTAVLCLSVICVLFSGCTIPLLSEVAQITQNTVSTAAPTATTALPSLPVPMTLADNGYAYSQLSEQQQANYTEVVKQLYEHRGRDTHVGHEPGLMVKLVYALDTEEEIYELFMAVYNDHPEFFYLKSQYGWTQLMGHYASLRMFYLWDAQGRSQRAAELEEVAASLVAACADRTDAEKALYFHDALIEIGEYNQAVVDADEGKETISEEHYEASSPYAALVGGDPICGGYTYAFHLLLNRVGIPNTPITNDDHVWTMLWLDGEAYHTDVTWDDPDEEEISHQYFNITDEEIRATRDYPAQEYDVPDATATACNYYALNGWYFTDAYDEQMDDCIREQIMDGNDEVALKFAPDVYEEALGYLLEEEAFFDAVYELEDDVLRDEWYSRILYYDDEELCTLRIIPDSEEGE